MTATNDFMKCTSCNKPKNQLKKRKSKVLPNVDVLLCQDCIDNKREPRAYLILAGRQYGEDVIAYWIKHHKYFGAPVTLRELM